MNQLKRIDEYVSKLFADSALNDGQTAIILSTEGGEGGENDDKDKPKTNGRCTNADFVVCSRENTYCTNYVGFCGNSISNGDCHNEFRPIDPIKNPCNLDFCIA